MLNYLDILGVTQNQPLDVGLEAKNMQKVKTFNITKTDFFLAPKITDPSVVYTLCEDENKVMDLFRSLATRESKLKVVRFKGYYIKPRYTETIGAKRIIKNMRPIYSELSKNKKQFNIGTLSTRTNTFKNISYMVNLGYILSEIKKNVFDKGILMTTKIRESILELIKNEILTSSDDTKERVLYLKGPFLTNTKIGLNIVDSMLLKVWNPTLLLLEWFNKDEEGFKKWLSDNKVNIVFESMGGSLVLSRAEKFQANPMYNFKYTLRLLHKLDGANLKELGLSQEEIDEIEMIIAEKDTDIEQVTSEELTELELVPDEDGIEVDEEEELNDFLDVDDVISDSVSDTDTEQQTLTKKEMDRIFDEVPEEEQGVELLELHNYTALKNSIETETVKKLRKNMLKNYGMDVKAIVNNIKNHKIDVVKFNNTVDNDYNQSNFIALDKSYQDKLSDFDLMQSLVAPSNLGFPLFLKNVEKVDISDREFRGYLLKAKYETHQGEELELELEVPTIENNSMFIGGSPKYLTNQDLAKPVIRTDEEVIITMAYNKTILSIKGKYASANDKMFVKTVLNFSTENDCVKVKTTEELSEFIYENRMSYRMVHLNKHFGGIRYKENGLDIDFDFRGKEVVKSGLTICGHINDQEIIHAPWKDTFYIGKNKESYDTEGIVLYVLELIDKELLEKSKVNKLDNLNFVNGVYCTIMARELPIVLIMLVETPLKDLLERLKKENGLEYSTVRNDKLDPSKLKNTAEYGYIVLEDYTIRIKYNNIINQLILVPLVNMDLSSYSVFDIAHTLKDLVGSDNTSIYLENFATSFIDPGSKRVLEMYNMPTDFTGLFIYAASLFYDYKTYYSSDAINYRLITPTEVINRIIYEIINKEFSANVARTKRGSRQMIKIPKDSVIKSLQTNMTNISEDSNISPFRSIMLKSSKSVAPVHGNMCLKSVLKAGNP